MKAISVEHVSKKFILSKDRPKNLAEACRSIGKRKPREDFWALNDVSFEVNQGEALGIIGHNGAGKSTVLKLLTRIMQPTSGHIRTRGRVSALIEVGAGFHPDMTGRENVYLNGSILGMTKREIDGKFDEIVAFSELEKFIDTPVKRYSSGMYARLGFSVAAHVQPDILIVDEVLAVGDAAFQQKCLDHMTDLRRSGCTIVFVSHNTSAVTSLCDTGVVIALGEKQFFGPVLDAVDCYTKFVIKKRDVQRRAEDQSLLSAKVCSDGATIESISLRSADGSARTSVRSNDPLVIAVRVKFDEDAKSPVPVIHIRNNDGLLIYDTNSVMQRTDCGDFRAGDTALFEFAIDHLPLKAGTYPISAELAYGDFSMYYDSRRNAVEMLVVDSDTSYGLLELPVSLSSSIVARDREEQVAES